MKNDQPATPVYELVMRTNRALHTGSDAMSQRPLRPFLSQLEEWVETILNRLGNPSAEELCAIASSEKCSEQERNDAIEVLGYLKLLGKPRIQEAAAVQALLPAFWAESRRLARSAATTLGQIKSRRATRPLLQVVRKAPNATNRQWAIFALGHLEDPRAVPTLLRVLLDSKETLDLRREALYALLVLRDSRPLPALIRILRNPKEPTALRGYAAEVLSVLGAGHPRAVAALIESLGDKDREVGFLAASALALCGDQNVVEPLKQILNRKRAAGLPRVVADQARYALKLIRSRLK